MHFWLTSCVLVLSLTLSQIGCSSRPTHDGSPPLTVEQANARAPFLPPLAPVVVEGELREPGDPKIKAELHTARPKWPLRFKDHFIFGERCINTLYCRIPFGRLVFERGTPRLPNAEAYSVGRIEAWTAGYISMEPPGKVDVYWRSLDGVDHHAVIDLGMIFKDRRVLHVVPREEVSDMIEHGTYIHDPHLMIEVNNRTINVYMRALVGTRHLQIPGNKYSGSRFDLILAQRYEY